MYELNTAAIAARLGVTAHAVEHHLVTAALAYSGCIDLSDRPAAPAPIDLGESA